jgi:hypothetical protein
MSATVTPLAFGSRLMALGSRPSAAECQLAAARGSAFDFAQAREDPRYDRYFRA